MADETTLTKEEEVSFDLAGFIEFVRESKPNDKSELDRRYAILITDLEKAAATFYHYAVGDGFSFLFEEDEPKGDLNA